VVLELIEPSTLLLPQIFSIESNISRGSNQSWNDLNQLIKISDLIICEFD